VLGACSLTKVGKISIEYVRKSSETNSEYELRVEKAKKELEDILELTERKSILTRRSSLSDTPTRRINLARASGSYTRKVSPEILFLWLPD